MAGVGERLVTGGNGRGHQVGKYCYLWLWKVFGFVISVGSGQKSQLYLSFNLIFLCPTKKIFWPLDILIFGFGRAWQRAVPCKRKAICKYGSKDLW